MRYQLTLLCISLVCAGSMLVLLRKSLLHPLHAVWWLGVGVVILLVGMFPGAFDAVGHALGVTYPPALYLAIAVVAMLIRILVADLERCKMMLQQRRMNQHLARLALRVRQLEQGRGVESAAAGEERTASDESVMAGGGNAVAAHQNFANSDARRTAATVTDPVSGRVTATTADGSHA